MTTWQNDENFDDKPIAFVWLTVLHIYRCNSTPSKSYLSVELDKNYLEQVWRRKWFKKSCLFDNSRVELNCFAREWNWMSSQSFFGSCSLWQFSSAVACSRMNFKCRLMSLVNELNIMQTPTLSDKPHAVKNSITPTVTFCMQNATKYTNGSFQSNGSLNT